jgi:DNA repair exonuclease SbcCD ATPase subunit
VLYLAEVLRKTRVIGGGKAEFKLLAYQRSEQSWSAVSGEEILPAPDDASYNAGVLVMLEVSNSKQVQRHTEAGRQLVSILQSFSRFQEKAKIQEEEIEQWKQSLTYQSQELNRREMEMEAQQEQFQQMEEDFERLNQQRQEVETAQAEIERLRQEFERKTQELEGAWAQLQGAENRLQERQEELQQTSTLDETQSYHLQELLNRISGVVAPTDSIQEQLSLSFEVLAQQQQTLDYHWRNLEQYQTSAQQLQEEADRQTQDIRDRWQSWHQAQEALEQARVELQVKQDALNLKQEYAQVLSTQLQSQEALYQQVVQLAAGFSDKVDVGGLEKMPLDQLETVVKDLERDLEKLSQFVHSQEEELSLQQEAIDDLRGQIQQASEYDRLRLETELADEQDRYQMLHQTLVGQRRNLQERQMILKQHQLVLAKRQGYAIDSEESKAIDLEPVLAQINQLRQQQAQELQKLDEQIQSLREAIDRIQSTVSQQANEQDSRREELRQMEQQVYAQIAAAADLWGKINTYRETLQPIQDGISGLKQKVEAIASVMTQFQEASSYQLQAIHEMRDTVQQLTDSPTPELAAS